LLFGLSGQSLAYRQRNDESRAVARTAFRSDGTVVPLGDFLTHSQSYSRPIVFAAAVQSLERRKDPIDVLLIKPDSIVLDYYSAELGLGFISGGPLVALEQQVVFDPDNGRVAGPVELQSIPDQVLKQLSHLSRISLDGWQVSRSNRPSRLLDLQLQI